MRRMRRRKRVGYEIIQKRGKSKKGKWTRAQRDYVDRAIKGGCIACKVGHNLENLRCQWHHEKQRWHGGGMRAPHHYGLALCEDHHLLGEESVHGHPEAFAKLVGMSEAELVDFSQKIFNWSGT